MADWTPAYSGLPILVLENWDHLKTIDLQKEFIRISSTYFHFGTLDLLSYKMELTNPDTKLI